jgi:formylglycine-generating enzyme required for sulfatase activity
MKARASVRGSLARGLLSARRFLLAALEEVPEERWAEQPSPAYSPIGWHLGHVASVQARWLLPGQEPRYGELFDPALTAKPGRKELPPPAELRAWLLEVFDRVCAGLEEGRVPAILGLPETFLVQHIAQHELQHAEHIQVIAALFEKRLHRMPAPLKLRRADRIEIPGGRVQVGCADAARAYDNERPRHEIELRPYWLDAAPVTAGEFARFARSKKGAGVAPLRLDDQDPDAPVTCVSWHDSHAYASWRGARLPTEHELEAASVPPSGVWEWTASWFNPYPGFRPYPYQAYSVPWFGTHRVLRGGSWATSPDLVRPSLRNWYDPALREIPSGFRCAGDL